MNETVFTGCIPALMTPCTPDRRPDLDALVRKGRELVQAGMSALVYCGSMGDWPLLTDPFESTTGGGVMIHGYDPVVRRLDGRDVCTTDYAVRIPGQPVLHSEIVFQARSVRGGTLCTMGAWRTKDGSASGTTPFEVFMRDGVRRRSP